MQARLAHFWLVCKKKSIELFGPKVLQIKDILIFTLFTFVLSGLIGCICAAFGIVLLKTTYFRDDFYLWCLPWLAFAGVIIQYAYGKIGRSSNKGIGLLFDAIHEGSDDMPIFRMIPLVISMTWLTHLCGGSAGREGVAVLIGGSLAFSLGRYVPWTHTPAPRLMLTAGMAAGFGALFHTPLAAAAFAIEVMHVGQLHLPALAPALVGAFTGAAVSHALGLSRFTQDIAGTQAVPALGVHSALQVAALGLFCAAVGALFVHLLHGLKGLLSQRLPSPYQRASLTGLIVSALALCSRGRLAGLGTRLIEAAVMGEEVWVLEWACKLGLTALTLAGGFQGGEVTPLFAIGATGGSAVAGLLGLPPAVAAAVGYACVFGAATRTLLAPVLLAGEVFGWALAPLTAVAAGVCMAAGSDASIYSGQRRVWDNAVYHDACKVYEEMEDAEREEELGRTQDIGSVDGAVALAVASPSMSHAGAGTVVSGQHKTTEERSSASLFRSDHDVEMGSFSQLIDVDLANENSK